LREPAFQATNTPVVGTKYHHQRSTQEVERGIFERFAKAAGLDVVDGSITQPDPPDIVCEIVGLGAVGFELTAVDDTAALTRMALNSRTAEFWAQALASLDPSTRARLRASHSDVQVALEYAEPGHKGERRTAMRAVLERREDYRSDQRLELLAYVRWGDAASLEDRDFADYLAQRGEGTPFIRIWLFETAFAQVVAHYP
jgi:hypothetical protein